MSKDTTFPGLIQKPVDKVREKVTLELYPEELTFLKLYQEKIGVSISEFASESIRRLIKTPAYQSWVKENCN